MHMSPTSSAKEIMATYLQRKEKLLSPVIVKTGPCKENIDIGDAVDVLKFPIPLIHGGDGGRYIGTWHTVITKDPGQLVGQLGYVPSDGPRSQYAGLFVSDAAAHRPDVSKVRGDE